MASIIVNGIFYSKDKVQALTPFQYWKKHNTIKGLANFLEICLFYSYL